MLKGQFYKPWPSLIWTALIFFLLTVKTDNIQSVPLLGIKNLDKLVHVFLFGMLFLLWAKFLARKTNMGAFRRGGLFLAVVAYGIGMEFYQDHFTTRAFELADIYADTAGAALAAVFIGAKNKPLWK
jgi:VanZ family protein